MNKSIRLLVESFFDDEIFNVGNDIKTDLEDLGRYYDYHVDDIFYQNKKPYAVCCGESKYFKNNKPRFCLLEDSGISFKWREKNKLVKELGCFKFDYFNLDSMNDFKHIDDDGYMNTLIIKNNYDISEFPAFKYCIELGENVYLPAIDELLMLYLNKNNLKGVIVFGNNLYCSSSLHNIYYACSIYTKCGFIGYNLKYNDLRVYPFFYLD